MPLHFLANIGDYYCDRISEFYIQEIFNIQALLIYLSDIHLSGYYISSSKKITGVRIPGKKRGSTEKPQE
jgi:hypothetical protein